VSIFKEGYRNSEDNWERILETEALKNGVLKGRKIGEQTKLYGSLNTARKSGMAIVYRFDKETYKEIVGEEIKGVVVGDGLADSMGLEIGKKAIFSFSREDGNIESRLLRVENIIKTGNMMIDRMGILVDDRNNWVGVGVTQLMIKDEGEISDLEGYEVAGWRILSPSISQMSKMITIFNNIVFGVVMVVVFAGIVGVMVVGVIERMREIGILMAIGYKRWQVRFQVVGEGVILATMGAILGGVIGLGGLKYLQEYGLDLSVFSEGLEIFGMDSIIYGKIEVNYFLEMALVVGISSIIAGVVPLVKLGYISASDVIRNGE